MAVSGHGDLDTIHDLLRYHTYITQSLVGESQKGQKMAIFAYFQYKTWFKNTHSNKIFWNKIKVQFGLRNFYLVKAVFFSKKPK